MKEQLTQMIYQCSYKVLNSRKVNENFTDHSP
jgi:hypothetical protein